MGSQRFLQISVDLYGETCRSTVDVLRIGLFSLNLYSLPTAGDNILHRTRAELFNFSLSVRLLSHFRLPKHAATYGKPGKKLPVLAESKPGRNDEGDGRNGGEIQQTRRVVC